MRILIVDDERPARDKLRRLLTQQAAQFGIGTILDAADGVQALSMIEAQAPDVLFLDIHMPEISGLELAASLPASTSQAAPLIVFVTAYDQYALQAFDANAIDYLLKPFDSARLLRALQRVHERWQARMQAAAARAAGIGIAGAMDGGPGASTSAVSVATMHGVDAGTAPVPGLTGVAAAALTTVPVPAAACGQPLRHLLISERGQTRVVRLELVEWIETADNYVILHCGQAHPLLRQTLSGLLANLAPDFVRCHRRAAVRIALVERVLVLDKGDADLLLASGVRVPCSRQYRAAVMAALNPA